MSTPSTELPREDRLAYFFVALAQSLALLALHKSLTHQAWPATDPRWLFAFYAVALGLPLFLYGGVATWRARSTAIAAGVLALLMFWCGWHAGWLAASEFSERGHYDRFVAPFGGSLGVALFIAAFNFRAWQQDARLDYARLLDESWRNALGAAFLVGFIGVFWLLLLLWSALFKLLDIDFFADLFTRSEFVYPVTGLIGGWGLGLIRERVGLVATVRRLCEVLVKALLPLVAFIVVIFLGTLLVTGLEPLWKTGFAAGLVLSLAVVLLFFVNVTLGDEAQVSLHPWFAKLVMLALVLIPANAMIAAWSLKLRVVQHGWTVDRLWGAFVIFFVAAWCFSYAASLIARRAIDLGLLRQANTILGLVLAGMLLLVNTPLAEFRRIAAKDQVTRLTEGVTKLADFDARYLRFDLGPYGIAQLEALKTSAFAKREPKLIAVVDEALAMKDRWMQREPQAETDLARLRVLYKPLPGTEVEDAFLLMLGAADDRGSAFCNDGIRGCAIGEVEHGGYRYRLLLNGYGYPFGKAWREDGGEWRYVGELRRFGCPAEKGEMIDRDQPLTLLSGGFFALSNGKCLYQVMPERAALERPVVKPR